MDIQESIKKIKELYPDAEQIIIEYNGSGDSFSDFYNCYFLPDNIRIEPDMNNPTLNDLLWYAIENSDADFNNDGSEGEIIIDLVNNKVSIDNYYIVQEREPSGKIEFE